MRASLNAFHANSTSECSITCRRLLHDPNATRSVWSFLLLLWLLCGSLIMATLTFSRMVFELSYLLFASGSSIFGHILLPIICPWSTSFSSYTFWVNSVILVDMALRSQFSALSELMIVHTMRPKPIDLLSGTMRHFCLSFNREIGILVLMSVLSPLVRHAITHPLHCSANGHKITQKSIVL